MVRQPMLSPACPTIRRCNAVWHLLGACVGPAVNMTGVVATRGRVVGDTSWSCRRIIPTCCDYAGEGVAASKASENDGFGSTAACP
jgi:hypothetical protein